MLDRFLVHICFALLCFPGPKNECLVAEAPSTFDLRGGEGGGERGFEFDFCGCDVRGRDPELLHNVDFGHSLLRGAFRKNGQRQKKNNGGAVKDKMVDIFIEFRPGVFFLYLPCDSSPSCTEAVEDSLCGSLIRSRVPNRDDNARRHCFDFKSPDSHSLAETRERFFHPTQFPYQTLCLPIACGKTQCLFPGRCPSYPWPTVYLHGDNQARSLRHR